ncbi:MAG TPA: GAF domain-containing protein, partial [Aggregatilineales bacterium]|nr:GAF domain-containing protein [Aggregatilineales bacterium]
MPGTFALIAITLAVGLVSTVVALLVVERRVKDLRVAAHRRLESGWRRQNQIARAAAKMSGSGDLEPRLQVMLKTFRRLGWKRVRLEVRTEHWLITEPPGDISATEDGLTPEEAWRQRWEGLSQETLAPYRLGSAYLVPMSGPPRSRAQTSVTPLMDVSNLDKSGPHPTMAAMARKVPPWKSGDMLIMPIVLDSGQVAAVISLAEPTDGLRPTAENLRPLEILTAQARTVLENNQLLNEMTDIANQLQQQVEEMALMRQVDQELGATLNFDNVMMLTLDWALRHTGAAAGALLTLTSDGTGLFPVAATGYPPGTLSLYSENNPLPISRGIAGRAVRMREMQIITTVQADPDYITLMNNMESAVAVPLEQRGRVMGVLALESESPHAFEGNRLTFVQQLAARSAVAVDNARLYRQAEGRANEMAVLYSAGRMISSSLERSEVLTHSAQALSSVLGVSCAVMTAYSPEYNRLTVTSAYRLGTVRNSQTRLPSIGESYDLGSLGEMKSALTSQRPLPIYHDDFSVSPPLMALLRNLNCTALLFVPLFVQDTQLGAALVIEGRGPRRFSQEEILRAETVASQAASALQQAKLFEDVRELEKLKSEMIRMASHDLRNPLGNVMGYFELLVKRIDDKLDTKDVEYVGIIRESADNMKSLIEDLLTLERVESERETDWIALDLEEITRTTVDAQQINAQLKQQVLSFSVDRAAPDAAPDGAQAEALAYT